MPAMDEDKEEGVKMEEDRDEEKEENSLTKKPLIDREGNIFGLATKP